ncbi:MAG: hypothetical protein J2P17_34900 [Mycobacterium sp.]|nr:hypothetical protein [Mycobacterium sp.]
MVGAALAITATVAIFLLWRQKAPRLAAVLALVVGAGLTGGVLGQLLQEIVRSLQNVAGQLTTEMIGAAVPAVLGIWMVLHFTHDMMNSASRTTAAIGLTLPMVAALIPGALGAFIVSMLHVINTGVDDLVTSLTSGRGAQ